MYLPQRLTRSSSFLLLFPLAAPLLAMLSIVLAATSSGADENLATLEEQAMRAAVAQVAPAVVKIETIGGLEKVGGLLVGTGPTTGLIVDPAGFIISSAFNFVQQPSSILVTLPGGQRVPAQVVATDRSRMLVLLKVTPTAALPIAEAVPAKEIRVGQWAIAVGRTFDSQQPNVSVGVVSAVNRIFGRALQTDAKISPSNYGGPLIDIRGRVLGVLVPLSPQATTEVAGVEWYDAGIGFAVPLTDILAQLPKLKEGQDLHRGLLGIGMQQGDPYTLPAVIATARPKSPARQAGFVHGDKIIEVDGHPVKTQMHLQMLLGPRYAGEKVRLTAMRKEQRLEHEVELVAKLPPYQVPFLGILPLRDLPEDAPAGIVVRYVYPESPAAQAGLQIGDRITRLGLLEVNTRPELLAALTALSPGDEVKLTAVRKGKPQEFTLTTGTLPLGIPGDLPPAREEPKAAPPAGNQPATGATELKLPEFSQACRLYVPENYRSDVKYGLLLWLHGSGGDQPEELTARWSALCKANDLILVAPQAADVLKWSPTDAEFVLKSLETVAKRYSIDGSRVIAHGYQAGGAMAYLLAFQQRKLFTAVAPIDAPLPGTGQVAENEPGARLAIFAGTSSGARFAERITDSLQKLRAAEYPVTVKDLGAEPRNLNPDELAELVRWIDALDCL